ncbi:phytoene/squalene synthase family protein [Nitratireductor mangrovi]|uniref:Phytoene/squalene synthase family protein n=1 Tax=Nitratireductor mangrovi TaxID=2599600 RepID=A0A5B8KUI6_9HYPH|nr:phytoene/squalene synthase family protein [Nitratireductor mangrovi]QDY99209.1 phytoene/squalene synthase family protein [Nitratireductor mangrovi]
MADVSSHAAGIVREADPDRYLSVLYAPTAHREALWALYAFDAETARIRDLIHEPMPGEIRLQWWRDAIAAGQATGHPVADALITAVAEYRLPVAAFDNMLEARIFDLYDDPMPDRTTLEGYCGETGSALIQLAAMVLDADAARSTADLAGHAGCAQVIAHLLRLLPLHASRGQCYVPADILAAVGSDREQLLAGGEGRRRAVSAMVSLAREHLTAFESGAKSLPPPLRPAFLPMALVPALIEGIEEAPEAGGRTVSTLRRHWLLLRGALRGW